MSKNKGGRPIELFEDTERKTFNITSKHVRFIRAFAKRHKITDSAAIRLMIEQIMDEKKQEG